MNELGPKQQTATGMSPNMLILSQLINDYWNESQSVNIA